MDGLLLFLFLFFFRSQSVRKHRTQFLHWQGQGENISCMCRGLIFSMVSILFAFVDGCGIAHHRRKIYGCFLT